MDQVHGTVIELLGCPEKGRELFLLLDAAGPVERATLGDRLYQTLGDRARADELSIRRASRVGKIACEEVVLNTGKDGKQATFARAMKTRLETEPQAIRDHPLARRIVEDKWFAPSLRPEAEEASRDWLPEFDEAIMMAYEILGKNRTDRDKEWAMLRLKHIARACVTARKPFVLVTKDDYRLELGVLVSLGESMSSVGFGDVREEVGFSDAQIARAFGVNPRSLGSGEGEYSPGCTVFCLAKGSLPGGHALVHMYSHDYAWRMSWRTQDAPVIPDLMRFIEDANAKKDKKESKKMKKV